MLATNRRDPALVKWQTSLNQRLPFGIARS
jgi:hypothetical protein